MLPTASMVLFGEKAIELGKKVGRSGIGECPDARSVNTTLPPHITEATVLLSGEMATSSTEKSCSLRVASSSPLWTSQNRIVPSGETSMLRMGLP